MTRTSILALLTASALIPAAGLLAADPAPPTQPEIPRKAPELVIQMQGKQVLLSQYRGYVLALAFMSTTCPHCQHLAGIMAELQKEYSSKGVQMLGVTFNPEANIDVGNFAAAYAKGMFPVGLSTDPVVATFVQHPPGIHYIPMLVFIDKQGIIRSQHLGINDQQYFEEAVEVQNIKNDLDKILKEPVIKLPPPKAAAEPGKKK